ncbi:unnamed protein product [Durusdinium trenchii]|uniref:Uncharacterized protein n=1 Tax=Durusdinium trenchii TaxID=1381693 RepID=A0ABP0S0K1_9DINO
MTDILRLASLVVACFAAEHDSSCEIQLHRWSDISGEIGPQDHIDNATFHAMQRMWKMPGHRFNQCPSGRGPPLKLMQGNVLSVLPDKKTCGRGEVPIGQFNGDAYNFTCCSGAQCGGCREVKDGVCQECAAGYVKQVMPVTGESMPRCFICDDVPKWTDSLGRSCSDYEKQGLCSGEWPKKTLDVAFHGLRPSDACCVCGGGSVEASPSKMPLSGKALFLGQHIYSEPFPIPEAIQLDAGCDLMSVGLDLATNGTVFGRVTAQEQTEISCSMSLAQDPVRGILDHFDLAFSVNNFSYGDNVVAFKYWGLDSNPSRPQKSVNTSEPLSNFNLVCEPLCTWLSMDESGTLHAGRLGSKTSGLPPSMKGSLTQFQNMPSCSCQVTALPHLHVDPPKALTTRFLAVQMRLWAGAYYKESIDAQVHVAISDVLLQEQLGPGLQQYRDHATHLPVVSANGSRFVFSPAVPPQILDVRCTAPSSTTPTKSLTFRWSHITGEVSLDGKAAFTLHPSTGTISGTPELDLSSDTLGRGSLDVTCKVALGGELYDKELPLSLVRVRIWDDTCWSPAEISSQGLWLDAGRLSLSECKQQCRQQAECAAVSHGENICFIQTTNGSAQKAPGPCLLRLKNCTEETAILDLSAPDAKYLQGQFKPSGAHADHEVKAYSRSGLTVERELILARQKFVHSAIPKACHNASWMLLHVNSTDYQSSKDDTPSYPEYFGQPMACIMDDSVGTTFEKGSARFDLRLSPSEVEDSVPESSEAMMKLFVPSCAKPKARHFRVGTIQDPNFYSLHACECFGEAHASTPPVAKSANAAVSRNMTNFNVGPVPDQQIFSGPYSCEKHALIAQYHSLSIEICRSRCHSMEECRFYLYFPTAQTCSLFETCVSIQHVGLDVIHNLYGVVREKVVCHIANPELCWTSLKRRAFLSLEEATVPKCLFQEQFDACDSLQLLSGEKDGNCMRCQYLEETSDREKERQKEPLPDHFPSGSQIQIACNETSRMFASRGESGSWTGPYAKGAVFTCVSGQWVGENDISLHDYSCLECVQLGTERLQTLSSVAMTEVYFLEHRELRTAPGSVPGLGCPTASEQTPSSVICQANQSLHLEIKEDRLKVSDAKAENSWWLDPDDRALTYRYGACSSCVYCLCEKNSVLKTCECSAFERWVVDEGQRLTSRLSNRCAFLNGTEVLTSTCPNEDDARYMWYFVRGNCIFGVHMEDTARKTWRYMVEGQDGARFGLSNVRMVVNKTTNMPYRISLFRDGLCLSASANSESCVSNSTCRLAKLSADCSQQWFFDDNRISFVHNNENFYLRTIKPKNQDNAKWHVAATPFVPADNQSFTWTFSDESNTITSPNKGCMSEFWLTHSQVFSYNTAGESVKASCPKGMLNGFQGEPGQIRATCLNLTDTLINDTCRWQNQSGHWATRGVDMRCDADQNEVLQEWHVEGTPMYNSSWKCCKVLLKGKDSCREEVPNEGRRGLYNVHATCGMDVMTRIDIETFTQHVTKIGCCKLSHYPNPDTYHTQADVSVEDCDKTLYQKWSRDRALPSPCANCVQLDTCQASLSVAVDANVNPTETTALRLEIQNQDRLSPDQLDAYNSTASLQIVTKHGPQATQQVLFSCLPTVAASTFGVVPCADQQPISRVTLSEMTGYIMDASSETGRVAGSMMIETSCPVLWPTSDPNRPKDFAMTAKQAFSMLQNQAYYSTSFDEQAAQQAPFSFNPSKGKNPQQVGYLSLPPSGAGMWGLRCPSGAVVASTGQSQPHCVHINAGKETTHREGSGSAFCPPGSAVSGWFNLPGVPVKGRKDGPGGPTEATHFLLFCRETPLLSTCKPLQSSRCAMAEVVGGVSFGAGSFKLSCCGLQKELGVTLLDTIGQSYETFEGYYCPSSMEQSTGSATYTRTNIRALGSISLRSADHSPWELKWNKFQAAWELREPLGHVHAQINSSQVSPVGLAGKRFSVTSIRDLRAQYLIGSKVEASAAGGEPKYPKLKEFHASEPDYEEYCDPFFLQNPDLFSGSMAESNPCYHAFNADPPMEGLPKGITEQDFWKCNKRESVREYVVEKADSKTTEVNAEEEVEATESELTNDLIRLGVSAAVAWLPGGSSVTAKTGAENTGRLSWETIRAQLLEFATMSAEEQEAALQDWALGKAGELVPARVTRWVDKDLENKANSYADQLQAKVQSKLDKVNGLIAPHQDLIQKALDSAGVKVPEVSMENLSAGLFEETMPEMEPPVTLEEVSKNKDKMAEAKLKDCIPLQAGLSKVMCDLFCVHDSVRKGTQAVLSSLQDSHDTLMQNIEALLNYQTKYILWQITQKEGNKNAALVAIPSSELLEEMRTELFPTNFTDFGEDLSGGASRDLLLWHQDFGERLLGKLAAVRFNVSSENWPFRLKRMRGMLRHFHQSVHGKVRAQMSQKTSEVAGKQLGEKIEFLRVQTQTHRSRATSAKSLRVQMLRPVKGGAEALWISLLESFLRSHEKHNMFTMMHLKSLDETDRALNLARNFSHCAGADTSALHEIWQRLQRSEEKTSEALLEAWAATVTAAERMQIAMEDEGFVGNLIEELDLDTVDHTNLEKACNSLTEISQALFHRAVALADQALRPLALQLLTFQALSTFQEQELKTRRLVYIPTPAISMADLKTRLMEIGDPSKSAGRRLAYKALNALGSRSCPAPAKCRQGMLVGGQSGWVISQPGNILLGEAADVVACNTNNTASEHLKNITLKREVLEHVLMLNAMP